MKKTLLSLLITLLSFTAFACLNGASMKLKNGHYLYEDYANRVPKGHQFEGVNLHLLHELDSLYHATKDISYLSDKGLVLIVMGKYEEAIRLYLDLERATPNRYATAANIGTAYELVGKNEEALKWIKKAVTINPSSHKGSEWIHINILNAKIKEGEAINSNFLLHTDFGTAPTPTSTLSADSLHRLNEQIAYQLNERISFIKTKDKIVASLFFDLGNLFLIAKDKAAAYDAYLMARNYGYNNFTLLRQRIDVSQGKKPIERLKISNNNWLIWPGAFLTLVIIFLAILSFRSKKNTIS